MVFLIRESTCEIISQTRNCRVLYRIISINLRSLDRLRQQRAEIVQFTLLSSHDTLRNLKLHHGNLLQSLGQLGVDKTAILVIQKIFKLVFTLCELLANDLRKGCNVGVVMGGQSLQLP